MSSLGSPERKRLVRDLICRNNLAVILQEKKLESISREIVVSVCNFINPGWCVFPSVGASRGDCDDLG